MFAALYLLKKHDLRLQPLIEKPKDIQTLTSLETWFSLPNRLLKAPPHHKMALVTWLAVFLMLTLLSRLPVPVLTLLPLLLNQLITTGLVVFLLAYPIRLGLTRLFRPWLYPTRWRPTWVCQAGPAAKFSIIHPTPHAKIRQSLLRSKGYSGCRRRRRKLAAAGFWFRSGYS